MTPAYKNSSENHIARDCDQPRDMSTVTCRNCDEVDYFSRDCTKNKNLSKVQCNNCREMGHTVRRCPQPQAEYDQTEENKENDGGWNVTNGNDGGTYDNVTERWATAAGGEDSWWGQSS